MAEKKKEAANNNGCRSESKDIKALEWNRSYSRLFKDF